MEHVEKEDLWNTLKEKYNFSSQNPFAVNIEQGLHFVENLGSICLVDDVDTEVVSVVAGGYFSVPGMVVPTSERWLVRFIKVSSATNLYQTVAINVNGELFYIRSITASSTATFNFWDFPFLMHSGTTFSVNCSTHNNVEDATVVTLLEKYRF